MKKKPTYRIRNWREYNRALTQRGSLTVWISDAALQNWASLKIGLSQVGNLMEVISKAEKVDNSGVKSRIPR